MPRCREYNNRCHGANHMGGVSLQEGHGDRWKHKDRESLSMVEGQTTKTTKKVQQKNAEDGIRTRASEEIGALNRRLRPTRPPPHLNSGRTISIIYAFCNWRTNCKRRDDKTSQSSGAAPHGGGPARDSPRARARWGRRRRSVVAVTASPPLCAPGAGLQSRQ